MFLAFCFENRRYYEPTQNRQSQTEGFL